MPQEWAQTTASPQSSSSQASCQSLLPGNTALSWSHQVFPFTTGIFPGPLVKENQKMKKKKTQKPTSIRCCRVKLDKDFTMLIWALFKSHDQYTTHNYKRGGKHSSTSITYINHRNSPCICYLNAPSTFLLELSTEGQCFVDYSPWQPWKESLSLHGKKTEATQFQLKLNWLYELWINLIFLLFESSAPRIFSLLINVALPDSGHAVWQQPASWSKDRNSMPRECIKSLFNQSKLSWSCSYYRKESINYQRWQKTFSTR